MSRDDLAKLFQHAVTPQVYSVVPAETRKLVQHVMQEETEAMLARHDLPHLKLQDDLHQRFFQTWERYASPMVARLDHFKHRYPTQGSSEGIREIIRSAQWNKEVVVVFEGEYEGYRAIAEEQNTDVYLVRRHKWRETMEDFRTKGFPWGKARAQWWISEPSALDGNVWPDFEEWLKAVGEFESIRVWIDLAYIGMAHVQPDYRLFRDGVPSNVAGVVFSLSKVMGAYYRRIGGVMSAQPIQGLWANQWFKNLDALYIGEAWMTRVWNSRKDVWEKKLRDVREPMIPEIRRTRSDWFLKLWTHALGSTGGAWHQRMKALGTVWTPSDVPLMIHVPYKDFQEPMDKKEHDDRLLAFNALGRRNPHAPLRLCITPFLTSVAQTSTDKPLF